MDQPRFDPTKTFDVFDVHDVPFDEDSGVTYFPILGGWRAEKDGQVEYIYLNPSGGSDDGIPTVFLYQGPHATPNLDAAITHTVVFDSGVYR